MLNPRCSPCRFESLSPCRPASGEHNVIADLRGKDALSKDALSNLTGRIVESYHDLDTIEHLDQTSLPNFQVVTAIVTDLKDIIFPGYHRFRNLHWTNARDHVGELLKGLYERLREQIACALRYEGSGRGIAAAAGWNGDDADQRAREKALAFLQYLPELRVIIATDVEAAFEGDPAAHGHDEIIFCYPGLEAITIYRLAHCLHSLRVPLIPRMMTEWAHSRTGIDVHPGARIGPGFFIDHGTGVVIGETCVIADHVTLYQGVTLGAISFDHDAEGNLIRGTKRHPTIEREVVIYANATVLGGQTVIGAQSVIGAGVSVTKSVPPNTIVTVEKPSLRFREAPATRSA
jgi:serine O-acetyltransferase